MAQGPDPLDPHPMPGHPRVCFLKAVVHRPNIEVGDYTYYDDPDEPERFAERNVLYHFDFMGDRLVIHPLVGLGAGQDRPPCRVPARRRRGGAGEGGGRERGLSRIALAAVLTSPMYPIRDTRGEATMKTDYIRVRVEPELKRETEAVLSELGLSMTDAVRMFCRRVVTSRGIPFDVRIPNEETIAAFQEDLSQAKGYDTFQELLEDALAEEDDED